MQQELKFDAKLEALLIVPGDQGRVVLRLTDPSNPAGNPLHVALQRHRGDPWAVSGIPCPMDDLIVAAGESPITNLVNLVTSQGSTWRVKVWENVGSYLPHTKAEFIREG